MVSLVTTRIVVILERQKFVKKSGLYPVIARWMPLVRRRYSGLYYRYNEIGEIERNYGKSYFLHLSKIPRNS